jgi:hypothetical protein
MLSTQASVFNLNRFIKEAQNISPTDGRTEAKTQIVLRWLHHLKKEARMKTKDEKFRERRREIEIKPVQCYA